MGYRFIGPEIHRHFYRGASPFELFSEIGVRAVFLQTLESNLELSEIRCAAGYVDVHDSRPFSLERWLLHLLEIDLCYS